MRVVQVVKPNAPLELVERPIPEPGPRQARIKVEACGVCHSDVFVVTGAFPGVRYPAVPGHEIAGRIDAIGSEVTTWRVGQRVGVGWFGGVCFVCDRCRRGDFITCRNLKIPGIHYRRRLCRLHDRADRRACAQSPMSSMPPHAAPLLCAGITTFNALRHSGARAGRRRGHSGHRRARPSRRAVRAPHGLSHRGHRPRQGQGAARARSRRACLYRQRERKISPRR